MHGEGYGSIGGRSKVSPRLGHARGLTPHRGAIQYPRAASLPSPTDVVDVPGHGHFPNVVILSEARRAESKDLKHQKICKIIRHDRRRSTACGRFRMTRRHRKASPIRGGYKNKSTDHTGRCVCSLWDVSAMDNPLADNHSDLITEQICCGSTRCSKQDGRCGAQREPGKRHRS